WLQRSGRVSHHELRTAAVLSGTLHKISLLNTTKPYEQAANVKFRKLGTKATLPPTPNNSTRSRSAHIPSLHIYASTRRPAVSPATARWPAAPPRVSPDIPTPAPLFVPGPPPVASPLPRFPGRGSAGIFRSAHLESNS